MAMYNSSKPLLLSWELQASRSYGDCGRNFGKSIASPAITAEIKLTTEQTYQHCRSYRPTENYKVSSMKFSIDQDEVSQKLTPRNQAK